MSASLLNGLMNAQSQTATPAGQQMQVVMIPSRNIIPNPENFEIYTLGDMENLRDDIRQNGLRQPLEVIPVEGEPDHYMLISGHRRWAACSILSACGESRFDSLPCLIRESHGKLDDRIALITANATARDLTDGERLAQYEALKDALTKKKAAGQLEGKVRDEVCRILGLSTGAAARLNVIASCENEVIKERLKAGEIGLMEAYRGAQDYARFMGAAPEEPEQKEEPAETALKSAPEFPKWVIESAKEVCEMNLFKKCSEFTAKGLSTIIAESGMCGRSLKTGFVDFCRGKIRFWKDENEDFTFTWAEFVKLCVKQKIAPAKEPAETVPSGNCHRKPLQWWKRLMRRKKEPRTMHLNLRHHRTEQNLWRFTSRRKSSPVVGTRCTNWRRKRWVQMQHGNWRGRMCVSGLRITNSLCPAGPRCGSG